MVIKISIHRRAKIVFPSLLNAYIHTYRVGQKTGLFLEVCNSRKTGVLYVTVFKYSLRNFSVTTLRSK